LKDENGNVLPINGRGVINYDSNIKNSEEDDTNKPNEIKDGLIDLKDKKKENFIPVRPSDTINHPKG
jgi:hypothetical protein